MPNEFTGSAQGIAISDAMNGTFEVFRKEEIGDISVDPITRPTAEVNTGDKSWRVAGPPNVSQQITIQMPSIAPHIGLFKEVREFILSQASMWYKLFTRDEISVYESLTANGSQAGVDTSGMLQLAVSAQDPISLLNPSFDEGMKVKIGAYEGTIVKIIDADSAQVLPVPAAAVADANFELLWPKMRIGPFRATPIEAGGQTRPVTGPLSSQIILLPYGQLPDEVIEI